MNQKKKASEEEEFDELMEDEEDEDESEDDDDEDLDKLPAQARKLTPEQVRKVKALRKLKEREAQAPLIPQARPMQTAAPQIQPKQRRFVAIKQPEEVAVAYADSNEIYAKDMPIWAAQMWSDLKNDIEEIKSAIGKI